MTISPKQLILPLILLLALPASRMAAQRHYIPHVHVGVHGGMSLSNQSFYPLSLIHISEPTRLID